MTAEEALKIADTPLGGHLITTSHDALCALADALREAQAQTVQMREDAARVAEKAQRLRGRDCCEPEERIAREIRALPAPAARTYDDAIRDAAKSIRDQATRTFGKPTTVANGYAEVVESLLSPAPAVAPVAAPKPVAATAPAPKRCPGCDVQEGLPCHPFCPEPKPAAPKPGPADVSVEVERLAARVAALESRLAAEGRA